MPFLDFPEMSVIDASKGRLRREGSTTIAGISILPDDNTSCPLRTERVAAQPKSAMPVNIESTRERVCGLLTGSCYGMRTVLFIFLLSGILTALLFFDKSRLQSLAMSLEENQNGLGIPIFFGLIVVAVMCFVPGPIMATLAGALYGCVLGSLLVWSAGGRNRISHSFILTPSCF